MVVKLNQQCKHKALYVKAFIIQNGVEDFQGDVLDSTDIKKIFTSYNNQDRFEVYHNDIPIEAVTLLENYISQTDELIAGTLVPKGSWNAVIRVDNPSIKEQLVNGDFGGVSLNNRVQTACSTGLTGQIRYSDLRDAECVIPVYISFVEEGANGVGLHIMDYDVYTHKSKNDEGDKKLSLLEDLKALISKAEEEEKEAEADVVADEPVEEEVVAEEVKKEATEEAEAEDSEEVVAEELEEEATDEEAATEDETAEEDEEPTIEKSEATESETEEAEEEVEIQKEAEDVIAEETIIEDEFDAKAEIEALKAEIEAIKEMLPQNPIDEEIAPLDDGADEPIITKSAKIEVTDEPADVKDFYERSGRDPITGKKIRKQSRILN